MTLSLTVEVTKTFTSQFPTFANEFLKTTMKLQTITIEMHQFSVVRANRGHKIEILH